MLNMADSNKKFIWILVIIGALIFSMQPTDKKEAQADVNSAQIARSISASGVVAGGTFTVTYQATNYGLGSWGVLFSDAVSGGCSPSSVNKGFLGPGDTSITQTITAPANAGTCTFTGTYIFGTSTEKSILGTSSISVTSQTSVCTDSLRATALNAISAWIINPTTENRNSALNSIVSWASIC